MPPAADRTSKTLRAWLAVDAWLGASARAFRAVGVALGCMGAAGAGALLLGPAPVLWLGLSAGVALAATMRWGRACALGAAGGILLAWSALGSIGVALGGTGVIVAGLFLAMEVLRRADVDARLERASDVGALAGIAFAVMALPLAAALSLLENTPFGMAWLALGMGTLAAALPVLTVDRRVQQTLQPQGSWREALLAAAVTAPVLLSLWFARDGTAVSAPWVLVAAQLLVVALALRGHIGMAATATLVAGLLVAAGGALGPLSSTQTPAFGAWFGSLLALLAVAHAATVDQRGRLQRWAWALDGSRLGVADWHVHRDTGFASSAWRAVAGPGAGRWRAADWVRQVHPDDRRGLEDAMAQLTTGAAGRSRLELRQPGRNGSSEEGAGSATSAIGPAGGSWRWCEATLLVIERSSSGQPTRLLATLADVDERHTAQERQRLSASLFQHLHEGLLVTDAEFRVLDANPAYEAILGVPRGELLGSVPSLLRPVPADPVARQQRAAMWARLRDSGSWRGELSEHRRDGEPCTLRATISTVHGPADDGSTGPAPRFHVLAISDITEQRVQRDQLERQAHSDELTRLPNRSRLSTLLDDAMRAADRDGYLLVVCYLDLDRFKPVNDRFGHAAGDRLLVELAGRLRSALRRRESWADAAARLGGDEFVLLLRAGTLEEARLAVERVLRMLAEPYVVDPGAEPVHVTASLGATVYPVDRSDADTLLRHADHAMYGAKQSGRNGYLFFDPEHRRRTEERAIAIGRVQEALDQSEFVLFYQPKVDMKSGHVCGFEALLRWDHPQQGLVAPMQFLPLIEHTGLSSRVGDWVLSRALEHLSQWRRDGLDISVSVNISARHLQESDFAQRLSELLARHAEPLAPHLELEMLETAAHADIEATSSLLARCRALGVRFALDDFGTGYSTLTYLKRLPVEVLKIDRSFVHNMLDDPQDRALVEGVIGLAKTFDCIVVAEGVESPAQARALLDMGCSIGQGTGIAAPMPASLVAGWMRDYKGVFALVPADAAQQQQQQQQPPPPAAALPLARSPR